MSAEIRPFRNAGDLFQSNLVNRIGGVVGGRVESKASGVHIRSTIIRHPNTPTSIPCCWNVFSLQVLKKLTKKGIVTHNTAISDGEGEPLVGIHRWQG
jgi:hypothetical protein